MGDGMAWYGMVWHDRAGGPDADALEDPEAALRELLGQLVVELGQLQPMLLRDLPAARIVRVLRAQVGRSVGRSYIIDGKAWYGMATAA